MIRELLDDTIASWRRERPDLDIDVMATALRLSQLTRVATRAIDDALAPLGITLGEFDVLAALRRGGRGTRLTPGTLARVAMVSPAGMTNRLDRLEAAELIARKPDPDDRRGTLVELTRRGWTVADRAIDAIVAAESIAFASISATDRKRLDATLDRLLAGLDEG